MRQKSNFIKVGTVAFGVPFAIAALWIVGGYGGFGWWLFLTIVAFLAAWAWTFFMWVALASDFQRISSASKSKEPKQPGDESANP